MPTRRVLDLLAACVRARLLDRGHRSAGVGQGDLLSCATAELDPSLRVVVAEEVFEADIPVPNVAQMQPVYPRAERCVSHGYTTPLWRQPGGAHRAARR